MAKRARSAITSQFVPLAKARRSPNTTVIETVRKRKGKK